MQTLLPREDLGMGFTSILILLTPAQVVKIRSSPTPLPFDFHPSASHRSQLRLSQGEGFAPNGFVGPSLGPCQPSHPSCTKLAIHPHDSAFALVTPKVGLSQVFRSLESSKLPHGSTEASAALRHCPEGSTFISTETSKASVDSLGCPKPVLCTERASPRGCIPTSQHRAGRKARTWIKLDGIKRNYCEPTLMDSPCRAEPCPNLCLPSKGFPSTAGHVAGYLLSLEKCESTPQ